MGNLFSIWKKKDEDNFTESFFTKTDLILNTTDLDQHEKTLFRRRYMNKMYNLRYFKHVYAIWFYVHRFLATTLGVAIPALLSVQYYYSSSVENPIYWTAWSLSILSGFATGYNQIFKVDNRYYLLKNTYQKLKNEGWSFILLCKKYDIQKNNDKLKHKAIFVIFMENIEEILDEYHKIDMETVMKSNKKEDVITDIQERSLGIGITEPSSPPITPLNISPEQIQKAQEELNKIQEQVKNQITQEYLRMQNNFPKISV